jgi:hypothetical protein
VKRLRQGRPRVKFCCDDPNLTPAAGLVTVAELDRVVGIGSHRARRRAPRLASAPDAPFGAPEVVLGFVESQLAGGDFMVDIDTRRADTAGAELRAIPRPPASTTAAALARRFGGKGVIGLSRCLGGLAAAFFEAMPHPEQNRSPRSARRSTSTRPRSRPMSRRSRALAGTTRASGRVVRCRSSGPSRARAPRQADHRQPGPPRTPGGWSLAPSPPCPPASGVRGCAWTPASLTARRPPLS